MNWRRTNEHHGQVAFEDIDEDEQYDYEFSDSGSSGSDSDQDHHEDKRKTYKPYDDLKEIVKKRILDMVKINSQ